MTFIFQSYVMNFSSVSKRWSWHHRLHMPVHGYCLWWGGAGG